MSTRRKRWIARFTFWSFVAACPAYAFTLSKDLLTTHVVAGLFVAGVFGLDIHYGMKAHRWLMQDKAIRKLETRFGETAHGPTRLLED